MPINIPTSVIIITGIVAFFTILVIIGYIDDKKTYERIRREEKKKRLQRQILIDSLPKNWRRLWDVITKYIEEHGSYDKKDKIMMLVMKFRLNHQMESGLSEEQFDLFRDIYYSEKWKKWLADQFFLFIDLCEELNHEEK